MTEARPFARPFHKSSSTVKLAVLQPGSGTEDIQIDIIDTDPETTAYDCVAYDRSNGSDAVNAIKVGGETIQIPRNLETAFRELRGPKTPRTLWADIPSEGSIEERNVQAATIKTIISNADKLIIWLGPGNHLSALAFELMKNLANRWQQACIHSGYPQSVARATMQQHHDLQSFLFSKDMYDLQGHDKLAWKEVDRLLSSSYFKYVQSISEILLAREIVVSCGASTISWQDFARACTAVPFFMGQQFRMNMSEELQQVLPLISGLHSRKCGDESLELVSMINAGARTSSLPDPRELIFSLLPIIQPSRRQKRNPSTKPPPVVDYAKTVVETFTDAARYIVHERQDLVLWFNESPPRRRKIQGLPSWVPDWTSPLPAGTVMMPPDDANGMRAWWEYIDPSLRKAIKISDNIMHVQAHVLDRVWEVSETFTQENCRRLSLQLSQRSLILPDETDEAICQRLFRTLALNQSGVGSTFLLNASPPDDLWKSFQSLLVEERIPELLNCTLDDLKADPELMKRAWADPQISQIGHLAGYSEEADFLIRQNAMDRSYFTTENGRTGMTAVQTLPPRKDGEDPLPEFEAMGEPIGRGLYEKFLIHMRNKDAKAAEVLTESFAGKLPGQAAPGVRSGDLIVALVGGLQPYILRSEGGIPQEAELVEGSQYEFVGDCYLHGVMNGEPFRDGADSWKREVELVNIIIV